VVRRCVRSRKNLKLEDAMTRVGSQCHSKKKKKKKKVLLYEKGQVSRTTFIVHRNENSSLKSLIVLRTQKQKRSVTHCLKMLSASYESLRNTTVCLPLKLLLRNNGPGCTALLLRTFPKSRKWGISQLTLDVRMPRYVYDGQTTPRKPACMLPNHPH
jgi:hypothetical protein